MPIGGGEVIADNGVALNTIIPPGETFPIRSWGSTPTTCCSRCGASRSSWRRRPTRASLILQFALYLNALPPDVVTVSTSGMSLNIAVAGPLTDFSLAITQLQGRALAQDVESFTKIIRGTFR